MRSSYNLLVHCSLIRATVFASRSKGNLDYLLRVLYILKSTKYWGITYTGDLYNIKILLGFAV